MDESPRSRFTTVSPETREAAKTVAMQAEATVDNFPNMMCSEFADLLFVSTRARYSGLTCGLVT
jgi:hypothetical protein